MGRHALRPARRGRRLLRPGGMIRDMRHVNLDTVKLHYDDHDPDGYKAGAVKLGPLVGGSTMAGGYYLVPPGQANCPYHYESEEEWLLVLEGRLTVRHPEG